MTFADFSLLCAERHSVRTFDTKPVAKEDVLRIVELAQLAPSVENLQPWHFHIISEHTLREKVLACCCYGNFVESAGTLIVVTVDRSAEQHARETVWNPIELEYSCVAAMEHIALGATAMGLGSSWVSLHHGTAHAALQLPHHEAIVGAILLGHRLRENTTPSHEHNRKPLETIVTLYE